MKKNNLQGQVVRLETEKLHLENEIERLKEEVNVLRAILNTQNEREYYSKFLKDFQKEKGKNVYPDFDEIYKRYDKQKEEIERLNNIINELEKYIRSNEWGIDYKHSNCRTHLLDILKGSDK